MNICFISLGCDKNLVDSEMMLGLLRDRGYSLTDDEAEADVIVINTCCFIHDAKQESIETILEMAEYKKTGKLKALVAAGCLAQRYREEIRREIPEVDALIGTTGIDAVADVVDSVLAGKQTDAFREINDLPLPDTRRVNTTGAYTTYLKIAEGCSKHCTYCAIPGMRGDYRSVPMERLVKEAEFLAEGGARELILVAQETTLYGVDLYGEKKLPELLKRLCAIEGIRWIRLLYCYPEEITPELIRTMKEEPKLCHYLDMPIQHASDDVLKAMGRRTSRAELEALIGTLRSEIPDIVLRTSLITGFPGETEQDHELLKEFVREMRFERLGVFTYSKEEGTPAAKRKDQIPKRVKTARQRELMELQQQIAFENAERMIGRQLDIMIEGRLVDEEVYVGRSYMDAPKIDGYVFLYDEREFLSGDIVRVEIMDAKGYDLIGRPVDAEDSHT
ncbi:MAG: 30S ribosomal protein S12 methylthiotransferase RimO [Lachnospiraceae bacterium]|nr:30S ribosomal protein S12 methylthiotransferase RimO [Lachnospiraceae bacterium]